MPKIVTVAATILGLSPQEKAKLDQQNEIIKTVKPLFVWLNGAVIGLIVVMWIGDFCTSKQIVTEKVIIALIAGVVAQAGAGFVIIIKSLFKP